MQKEKKKILYVVEAMGGGVFTHLVTLANGLCDEFDITLAYGLRNETPTELSKHFDPRVKLVRIKNFTREIRFCKDQKAAKELKKLIKELQPDIVHLHSSKAGALGRLRFRGTHYKLFYTPHGYSFLMEDINSFKRHSYKNIERLFGKKDCLTVACGKGEWLVSQTVTKNTTYINNGINTKEIDQILAGETTDHDEFTVCTLGRMGYQKNPALFNELATRLPDVKFVWVGDGELKDELTSPNITKVGWVSREESLRILNKSDVFVLTSRWEGLPMSLIEAMYIKKPCVVSDVLGNAEMVVNDITGYICRDTDEFVKKINKVRKEPNKEMVERAYELVINNYTDVGFCQKYRELYRKYIDEE